MGVVDYKNKSRNHHFENLLNVFQLSVDFFDFFCHILICGCFLGCSSVPVKTSGEIFCKKTCFLKIILRHVS